MDRLHSLRVFQRVVDEGGFAAAARALDLSPAVVTRLVADLEHHLGTRLLHRTTRRVALTEAGQAYLDRVRPILQDLEEADAHVSTHTREPAGTLRVLAPPVLATHVLAPLVAGFRQAYPRIRLQVEVDNRTDPPVEDHDVTLIGTTEDFDRPVVARRIIATEAVLVASPGYLVRRGTPRTPADLQHHDCLLLVPNVHRLRGWRLFRADQPEQSETLTLDAVLQSNHTDTLMRAALDGAGITATSTELAAPHMASGALVRVLSPWIIGRLVLYAALPSRKHLPQRTRVFLDYLSEQTQLAVTDALSR